jgi:hypothetical protein
MYRMKSLLLLMSLILVTYPARAVDFRWTSSFNQGTLEAIIQNGRGSSLNIYCPLYQTDTTPGMFLEVKRIKPTAGEPLTVQIIVDDKNHAFYFNEIEFEANTRINQWALREKIIRSGISEIQDSGNLFAP